MRSRRLEHAETGKIWSTHCEGSIVKIRAGLPGKEKETQKVLVSDAAAQAHAEKEEWARLKKGFVLCNPEACMGEPRMHCYLSRGYTGALVATEVSGQFLTNRYNEDEKGDSLLLIDDLANLTEVVQLPQGRLAWAAFQIPSLDRILIKADHQVLALSLQRRELEVITQPNPHPVSFLSVAGKIAAWYAEPDVVITNLTTGQELFRRTVTCEMYGGHSLQMEAALSADGAAIAVCSRPGTIDVFDVLSGQLTSSLSDDFEMISKLAFSPDHKSLVALEQYGKWHLHCFNVQDGKPRANWPSFTNMHNSDFAVEPAGRRIAIARGNRVEVLELATMNSLTKFRADHVVKCSAICWVGHHLALRTDYGCASIYGLANLS